jgi:hypothetical protein
MSRTEGSYPRQLEFGTIVLWPDMVLMMQDLLFPCHPVVGACGGVVELRGLLS